MKQSPIVILALFGAGVAAAQEMELQVELMRRLGTQTSRKGGDVFARIASPDSLRET
jgi:hypothetical protein